jgi:hypothetical protein
MQIHPDILDDDAIFTLASENPDTSGPALIPCVIVGKNGQDLLPLFLSQSDAAMTAMVLLATKGTEMAVTLVKFMAAFLDISPSMFLAWQAYSGKLVLNPNSVLTPVMRGIPRRHKEALNITPGKTDLLIFDCIRELAGLHAWKEAARTFVFWDRQRQVDAMQRGLKDVSEGILSHHPVKFNQLAVFDPEFVQWHFVNVSDLTECLAAQGIALRLDE